MKNTKNNPENIKNWPIDERPREKLLKHGAQSLADTELLAILLRTGVKGESAIDLARKILQKFKTFRKMSHTDIRDWKEFKGLGNTKIAQLKAALEIAQRFNNQEAKEEKTAIESTEDVVRLFETRMKNLKNEVVSIILCDPKNRIIETIEMTKGTPTESYPIIREAISIALQNFASGIICIHNHPLGDPEPTKDDEIFTSALKEAGKLMGIKLLDHIIFGEEEFYSFDQKIQKRYEKSC